MPTTIDVANLRKAYKSVQAVNGVCFSVQQGEIFGILGPNGAGKTTTIEILEGLRKRDSGTVRILGLDPERDHQELTQRIGVQFQSTSIQQNMKVGEALDMFSSFYRKRTDMKKLTESLGLQDRLNTQFRNLSGGWKQRVALALATVHDPDVVFLDEPSTGLDPQARRELWALIHKLKQDGKTIVITTHYMEEAERLCDRIAIFKQGQVIAMDTPKRLVSQFAAAKYLSFQSIEADMDAIRRLPGVQRIELHEGSIHVYSPTLQHTSLCLFQLAEHRGWTLDAFRFEVGTLDDLYVNLVGKEMPV